MDLYRNFKTGQFTSQNVRTVNNTVIFLMILIATSSIMWSISIYMMPIEMHNAFVDVKLSFRQRDYSHMTSQQKQLLNSDLQQLINRSYTAVPVSVAQNDGQIKAEKHTMTQEEMSIMAAQTTTRKPKIRKIAHVFLTIADVRRAQEDAKNGLTTEEDANETDVETVKFNATQDRLFLETMTFSVASSESSSTMSMIEGVPFLSEVMAVIGTAMFLIFQSSITRYSVLPKPWRIVLPSIVMCTIMTLSCLVYAVLAHKDLSDFCQQLRANLTDPNILSCGEALTVLRPVISYNKYKPDMCLTFFRVSFLLTLMLWCLALATMFMRYFFAIDFQVADHNQKSHNVDGQAMKVFKLPEYTAVSLQVQEAQNRCSEDDFSSAKSHVSEVAIPLL